MGTPVFCVELKMGPSGHMDSTGIFPDSNTREFGPRRTKQRQPPRPTHKCNAPRLPFHVHLTHDLTRAASALPLHTAALAFVSFGVVLVQVQVQVQVPWNSVNFKNKTIFQELVRLPAVRPRRGFGVRPRANFWGNIIWALLHGTKL